MSHAAPSAKGDGEGCAFIVGLCIRHCLRRGLCRFASDVWFARWYGCSSRNLTVRVVAGTSADVRRALSTASTSWSPNRSSLALRRR